MGRIIEILKEFQSNSQSLSLTYLVAKFSLTIRTLQKDIQRINSLLSEISNCKIIKDKDQLVIVGNNSEFVINHLLKKLLKSSNKKTIEICQLLLHFIWESQPLSNSKLINLTNSNLYNLKQKINLINNFFQYYQLNLCLKFITKKGWMLVGCEQDLRILTTKILINFRSTNYCTNYSSYPSYYLDVNLFHLTNKLEKILLENNIYNYYFPEILYFLIVVVKRIKINKLLNNYHCHFLLQQLLDSEMIIKTDCDKFVNLLQKNFVLKINNYEISYLKSLIFFNQKSFNNSLFSKLIFNLRNLINDLIFKKYHLSLMVENFKTTLNAFLKENYLRLVFNFISLIILMILKKIHF